VFEPHHLASKIETNRQHRLGLIALKSEGLAKNREAFINQTGGLKVT